VPFLERTVSKIIGLLTLLILVLGASAAAQSEGEQLYAKNCIQCHSFDGSGHSNFGKRVTIPDLRSPQIQSKTHEDLFASIGKGVGHKEYPHAFLGRGMTVPKINDLISYIRTLKK
jgi:mono/diheme cytochrome c family protein